jgi:protein gp37
MAETTIEWTATRQLGGTVLPGYTFNPWIGCAKVSPACTNCYAEVETPARVSRAKGVELWGPKAARQVTSASNWRKPLAWNRAAAEAGQRRKVFCASLADVFEDRPDLHAPRQRLGELIAQTPNLDWLLLTKRPENLDRLIVADRLWDHDNPLSIVWLGVSVEDQRYAEERIPLLLGVPASVRFLSCEPLLEALDLRAWLRTPGVLHWVAALGHCRRRIGQQCPSHATGVGAGSARAVPGIPDAVLLQAVGQLRSERPRRTDPDRQEEGRARAGRPGVERVPG